MPERHVGGSSSRGRAALARKSRDKTRDSDSDARLGEGSEAPGGASARKRSLSTAGVGKGSSQRPKPVKNAKRGTLGRAQAAPHDAEVTEAVEDDDDNDAYNANKGGLFSGYDTDGNEVYYPETKSQDDLSSMPLDDYEQHVGEYQAAESVSSKNNGQRWTISNLGLLNDAVDAVRPLGGPDSQNSPWEAVSDYYNAHRKEGWLARDTKACYRKFMNFPKCPANVRNCNDYRQLLGIS